MCTGGLYETRLLLFGGELSTWAYCFTEYTVARGYDLIGVGALGNVWRISLNEESIKRGYIGDTIKSF